MDDGLKSQYDYPTPLLHLTFILQQSSDNLLYSSLGVGLSSVRIMSALSDRVPRSQQEVAVRLGQTEANISRQLKQMKKQGLVSISRNKKDKRQKDVALSQKGHNRLQRAAKLLQSQQSRLMTGINKADQRALDNHLQKLILNI